MKLTLINTLYIDNINIYNIRFYEDSWLPPSVTSINQSYASWRYLCFLSNSISTLYSGAFTDWLELVAAVTYQFCLLFFHIFFGRTIEIEVPL